MITPRNPIFRPRKVTLELFTNSQSIPPTGAPTIKIELTEVNSIEFISTSQTVIAPGVVTAVIQPWYFLPITLNITGRSFVGAFGRGAFGVAGTDIMADKDAGKLISIRQFVNQKFFHSFSTVRGLMYRLTYEDPEDTENLSVSQTLIGLVSELGLNETDPDPYVRAYRIRFVGEDIKLLSLLNGANMYKEDDKQAGKTKSDPVASDGKTNSEEAMKDQTVVSEQDDIATKASDDKEGSTGLPDEVSDDGKTIIKKRLTLTQDNQLKTVRTEMDINGDGKKEVTETEEQLATSDAPSRNVVQQFKTTFIGGPTASTGSKTPVTI